MNTRCRAAQIPSKIRDQFILFFSFGELMMKNSNPVCKRSGFTLIELLVVIAIIGVLVGLLLPAVQQAREAARRSSCGNKMKQNALGMHTYADANLSFPSATNNRNDKGGGTNAGWSTFTVHLMPFLELSQVFDKLDLGTVNQTSGAKQTGQSVSNWNALAPANQAPPIYKDQLCPSNPYAMSGQMLDESYHGNNNKRHGGRHYDVCLGPSGFPSRPPDCAKNNSYCNAHPNWWYANNNSVSHRKSTPGIFNWSFDFPCTFEYITDGTSNTFLMLERRPEIAVWAGMYRQQQLGVTTGIRPNSSTINEDPTMIKNNAVRTTNSGASSYHPGVFAASTADAAVHFLSDTVDFEVYNYLGGRMDGNPRGKLP